MRTFYSVVGGGFGRTAFPFQGLFENLVRVESPADIKDNDGVLCLWGGEDISPSLYDQRPSDFCGAGATLSERDIRELECFNRAVDLGLPILGICRGAQLACALLGGKLVQDVRGHAGVRHRILTDKNEVFTTTSVHHQQLYPWDIPHEMIAWADGVVGRDHTGEDTEPIQFPREAFNAAGQLVEPEIVYFPQAKCLAIQGHPEFMRPDEPFVAYCNHLIQERLLSDANQPIAQ